MADYIELSIPVCDSEQAEILIAELADFPFESFMQEETLLKAYIPENELETCRGEVAELLTGKLIHGTYKRIETVNWNQQWESDFEPVYVDGRCVIRAPFHDPAPDGALDVVIMPKMSFGTGHHATTWLMVASVLDIDVTGKNILDMGSGTGVLAIVAVMCGARHADAVDIDQWAYDNCSENIAVNRVEDKITPILGDVGAVEGRNYDVILANINRNILLADMKSYVAALNDDGMLIMSGVLEADIPVLEQMAHNLGLTHIANRFRDGWAALEYKK